MKWYQMLYFILLAVPLIDSSNILYIIPYAGKSHYIMLRPIGLELSRRGHNVTVITANSEAKPPSNYHQVLINNKTVWDKNDTKTLNLHLLADGHPAQFLDDFVWSGCLALTESAFQSPEFQHFLHQDNKFDIVIVEEAFMEAFYILAHKYNAPLALVTTYGNSMKLNYFTRNPLQIASLPAEFIDNIYHTTFRGRLRKLYDAVTQYFKWRRSAGLLDELIKKYVPNLAQPVPSIVDIHMNISLILMNNHFTFAGATSYLPNLVEIGGIHLAESNTTLPEDLQKVLDTSEHGVIYMNFGSNVRISEMSEDKRNAFLNVFRKLKQTVIWKWEDDHLPNIPKNLVVKKWLPQCAILAHPNVKVFISHGGLIGTQEAVFYGVPILSIPIYGDQYLNAAQIKKLGIGDFLRMSKLNEEILEKKLIDVLDDSYKQKSIELAERFKDRLTTPMDTAMYWIEYVIRHEGAKFMKSMAQDLSWIENNMIDVYSFIVIVLILIMYVLVKLITLLLKISNNVVIPKLKLA